MKLAKNLEIRITILLILCLAVSSCSKKDDFEEESAIKVSSIKVENQILDSTLNNFGTISYKEKTDLTTQVSGTITGFTLKEGSYVYKGQTIALLKNIQLEIQKEEYESNLRSAKASYEIQLNNLNDERLSIESRLLSLEKTDLNIQQKELELESSKNDLRDSELLHDMGGITDSELENLKLSITSAETDIAILKKEKEISYLGLRDEDLIANGITPSDNPSEKKEQIIQLNLKSTLSQIDASKAQVDSAEQQLDAIEKLLDELVIKAPVSGIIATKYYENNEYIKEEEKIATIINVNSVYAVFYIQEQDMVNFTIGTNLSLSIPSLNKNINGKIDEISPIADSQTGNFSVKAEITNNDGYIKPGMFVKCSIQRLVPELLPCINDTAVFSISENTGKVYCIKNNYLTLRNIKIKAHKNGKIWIDDGLKENEQVVDNPSSFLREGQYVELK